MKHYKQLIDKDLFEQTYNVKLEDYDLYANIKGINQIPTICDNCHQIFWVDRQTFKKRLCYTEVYEKCFGDTWYCNRKECTSKKKSEVCKIKMLQSEDSINKRLEASKNRRGKTYEEQYGEEKAKEIKAVIKQKRKEQPEPMKGKHHSDKAKLLMSLRKQEIISKGELNWTNPITGEPCTYIEEVTTKAAITSSKRLNIQRYGNSKKSYVKRWFDNELIFCQSSYEKHYAELLNINHIYYDKCNFKIPYYDGHHIRMYIPDFTLYLDDKLQHITHIVEVKPKKFLKNDGYFIQNINILKLKALEDFCGYNNYKMMVITEDELNENKIY